MLFLFYIFLTLFLLKDLSNDEKKEILLKKDLSSKLFNVKTKVFDKNSILLNESKDFLFDLLLYLMIISTMTFFRLSINHYLINSFISFQFSNFSKAVEVKFLKELNLTMTEWECIKILRFSIFSMIFWMKNALILW